MIEVVLSRKEYVKFTAEAKKRMYIKGWDMSDLAEHVNRPVNSVRIFFSQKRKPSRFLAAEIAKALEMELKDWK